MAANDYIRTVNITPLSTSYSWDTPPSWITITRIGSSNDWTITLAPNSGSARNATLTVRHANTTTVDTISVSQNGVSSGSGSGSGGGAGIPTATPVSPTATPVSPTATPVSPTATPIPPAPTATSPTGAGLSLSFSDPSFSINDYNNGEGSSVDIFYNITGTTLAPTFVEKDNLLSYQIFAPSLGTGTIRLTSLASSATFPTSFILAPDFKISHPLNSSITASIDGTITQAQGVDSGGGGCHIAGEMITLANGETKAVEDIQVGDQLLSFNVDGYNYSEDAYKNWASHIDNFNGEFTSVEVTLVNVDTYSSYYDFNNGALKITYEHPILIKGINNIVSWKTAREAAIGEFMLNENSQWIPINAKSLVSSEAPFSTWSFDVETEDVYFANGILVHNLGDREIVKDIR